MTTFMTVLSVVGIVGISAAVVLGWSASRRSAVQTYKKALKTAAKVRAEQRDLAPDDAAHAHG